MPVHLKSQDGTVGSRGLESPQVHGGFLVSMRICYLPSRSSLCKVKRLPSPPWFAAADIESPDLKSGPQCYG